MVGECLVFTLRYLLASLCKGSWREATEGLSAAMLDTDSPKNGVYLGLCCAIPPVRCEPNRLPLHKGGKKFDLYSALSFTLCSSLGSGDPLALRASVSLRLGHGAALTCHRHVIHYRAAASLPKRGAKGCGKAPQVLFNLTSIIYHNPPPLSSGITELSQNFLDKVAV